MKKLILPLMLLATMFACTSPEKKADVAANPEDTETGSYVSIDDKTAKFKQLLEAAMKNDTAAYRTIFVDTLKTQDAYADNVDSLDNVKNSFEDLGSLLISDSKLHTLYDDIQMTTNKGQIKTFTFTDGRVATGYWGIWSGKGKFTKKETKVPLHMIAWWNGDKIVGFFRMFDSASLKGEIAASQAK